MMGPIMRFDKFTWMGGELPKGRSIGDGRDQSAPTIM